MNYKKILSTALTVIMIFSMVAVFIPVGAKAAYNPSSISGSSLSAEAVKEIVLNSYTYNYASAQELLDYEIKEGYIVEVSSGAYNLYVNRYTGAIYYKNNDTGEILTSNPYNVAYQPFTEDKLREMMSQITIEFGYTTASSKTSTLTSADAAERAQISVSRIAGGLRVNYTLGDTTTRYLAPGQITNESFVEKIMKPIIDSFASEVERYLTVDVPDKFVPGYGVDANTFIEEEIDFSYFENPIYADRINNQYGAFDTSGALRDYLTAIEGFYKLYYPSSLELVELTPEERGDYKLTKEITAVRNALDAKKNLINQFLTTYKVVNPNDPNGKKDENVKLYDKGVVVWVLEAGNGLKVSNWIKQYCGEYNFQEMALDEAECEYTPVIEQKPVFRCSIEYTFNDDGSLSVRLPASSITFDETAYILKNISLLPMFGAVDLSGDGYVFVPDGSGSVIEFEDFYNANIKENVRLNLEMYGKDYCYSALREKTGYVEQVTMPVFGIVSDTVANAYTAEITGKTQLRNGYFAILEEGSSLANLGVSFGGATNKFGSAYVSFSPNPSDTFKLSDSISVGGSGSITKVSESKYSGSYVTRYVMLSDATAVAAAQLLGKNPLAYEASYNGMAAYYRDFLKKNGTLKALDTTYDNLPLYIEALGSMEIVKKVMSFPVTTDIPLTTFEDVATMYEELSTVMESAKQKFLEKANEYDQLVKDIREEGPSSPEYMYISTYEDKADKYRELAANATNLNNVNFKLTGFANGGMYYTYPTRVKWDKVSGGSRGFKELIDVAKSKTKGQSVFGIYPEFDFSFITNTASFDGVSAKKNASKMVDNRYASKQIYNSIYGMWESVFALVVSPDSYDRLYDKFEKKYSKYDVTGLSVSTLGEVLNSNFDIDNPINREESLGYVTALLDRMANEDGYDVMVSKGNSYALKYASHVIDISTDSSHYRYSSYNVPFLGMVLHGYMNYAGSPLNYSGAPAYDILHSIENGAALYYILCYQNTGYMKDDEALNDYYGVDYLNWRDKLVEQYTELNSQIGGLQKYEIVNHRTLIAERVIENDEFIRNNVLLVDEFVSGLEANIVDAVNAAYDSMVGDSANVGRGIKLTVDIDAIYPIAEERFNLDKTALDAAGLSEKIGKLKADYEARYNSQSDNAYNLTVDSVEYDSKYNVITDSFATDEDYVETDYTVDNDLVTIVTYRDAATGDEVKFIINYNIYAVEVRFEDGTVYTIGKLGYQRID